MFCGISAEHQGSPQEHSPQLLGVSTRIVQEQEGYIGGHIRRSK